MLGLNFASNIIRFVSLLPFVFLGPIPLSDPHTGLSLGDAETAVHFAVGGEASDRCAVTSPTGSERGDAAGQDVPLLFA